MNIREMDKQELAKYLGTQKDILSDNFWDNDSEDIFYMDSDLNTVKNEMDIYIKDFRLNGVYYKKDELFELIHLKDFKVDYYVALFYNN